MIEKVNGYTFRGEFYPTEQACRKVVENAMGAIVSLHAGRLAQLDKYTATIAYLEEHAKELAKIAMFQEELDRLPHLKADV